MYARILTFHSSKTHVTKFPCLVPSVVPATAGIASICGLDTRRQVLCSVLLGARSVSRVSFATSSHHHPRRGSATEKPQSISSRNTVEQKKKTSCSTCFRNLSTAESPRCGSGSQNSHATTSGHEANQLGDVGDQRPQWVIFHPLAQRCFLCGDHFQSKECLLAQFTSQNTDGIINLVFLEGLTASNIFGVVAAARVFGSDIDCCATHGTEEVPNVGTVFLLGSVLFKHG